MTPCEKCHHFHNSMQPMWCGANIVVGHDGAHDLWAVCYCSHPQPVAQEPAFTDRDMIAAEWDRVYEDLPLDRYAREVAMTANDLITDLRANRDELAAKLESVRVWTEIEVEPQSPGDDGRCCGNCHSEAREEVVALLGTTQQGES